MTIEHITADEERAYYGSCGLQLNDCTFAGPADGESALKESKNIRLSRCRFELRYPLWHDEDVFLEDCEQTETCRAALWYSSRVTAENCRFDGIKVLRECRHVSLKNCRVKSPECGWFCRDVSLTDSRVEGEYFLLHASGITASRLDFHGKYSFQYTENVQIDDSVLDTKDAFWHARNVTVRNSTVKGEYLGWYSEGLTLVNCRIEGTQPLCYCKRLTLINCTMVNCDLAFEYSDVTATLRGKTDSIKNPSAGHITAEAVGELIFDEHARGACPVSVEQ